VAGFIQKLLVGAASEWLLLKANPYSGKESS